MMAIHQTSFRRRERLETGRGVEPLQGERPPGAVANEPLETRSVLALDAERAVDGEASGAPPRAHVRRLGGVQERAPCEQTQDAKLHRTGQGLRVSGLGCGSLVEAHPALDVAGDHAIEGQHGVVKAGDEAVIHGLRGRTPNSAKPAPVRARGGIPGPEAAVRKLTTQSSGASLAGRNSSTRIRFAHRRESRPSRIASTM
jgi:hypothetical protein